MRKRLDRSEIELTTDLKARELRFEEVPETEVRPPAQTERENLPEEVEPDVTYRNPGIRLRIASARADADQEVQNDGLERPEESDVEAAPRKES